MSSSIKGKKVFFDERYLHVELADGRIISTPLDWYPDLKKSTVVQLRNCNFICRGTGIEWPDIDYHLNIAAMLHDTSLRCAA